MSGLPVIDIEKEILKILMSPMLYGKDRISNNQPISIGETDARKYLILTMHHVLEYSIARLYIEHYVKHYSKRESDEFTSEIFAKLSFPAKQKFILNRGMKTHVAAYERINSIRNKIAHGLKISSDILDNKKLLILINECISFQKSLHSAYLRRYQRNKAMFSEYLKHKAQKKVYSSIIKKGLLSNQTKQSPS